MRICVIGGGASGMMCATLIARKGYDVTLFEKNEKLGKKLYITGKGRCNVTNYAVGNDFLKNVVNGKKFMMGAITRFNSSDTIKFFEELGVPLKVERGERVFPQSDKSSDIIRAFERALKSSKVNVCLNSNVSKIIVKDGLFSAVVVNGEEQKFDACIVATGGITYPATGSTGDGYKFAREIGHTITEPVQALCGIRLADYDTKLLEGLSLKNVRLIAKMDNEIKFQSDIGEMLFTKNGISGPIVLTASSFINRLDFSKLKLYIDFKPAINLETIEARLSREIANMKAKQFSTLLESFLPKSMISIFAGRQGIELTYKANQLTKEMRKNIAFMLKNFELMPTELEDFNQAVITSGGVNLKEINPKFMQSKLVRNIYFIGEVLDVDALTGGFNLQVAFSTASTCASAFDKHLV